MSHYCENINKADRQRCSITEAVKKTQTHSEDSVLVRNATCILMKTHCYDDFMIRLASFRLFYTLDFFLEAGITSFSVSVAWLTLPNSSV